MAHLYPNRYGGPYKVEWCGFRSDTYTLGRYGWECAVEEDLHRMDLHIMLHHPKVRLTLMGAMEYAGRHRHGSPHDMPPFVLNRCHADHQHVVVMDRPDFASYTRVDTEPSYVMNTQEMAFADMPFFRELFAPHEQAQQLIIDPQDVQAMLDQIMKVQAPERKEIRKRDLARERRVHAEIISLAA